MFKVLKEFLSRAAEKENMTLAQAQQEFLGEWFYQTFKSYPETLHLDFSFAPNNNKPFLKDCPTVDWGIDKLEKKSWTTPFPRAAENQSRRQHLATWTKHCPLHRHLNSAMGPYLEYILLVSQVFENIRDLAFDNLVFSPITGTMNNTFYWKSP